MRKSIVILLCLCTKIFPVDFIEYKMHLVKEYKTNKSHSADEADFLNINNSQGYSGPGGPGVMFVGDNLIIIDQEKLRSILVNEVYSFEEVYDMGLYNEKSIVTQEYILGYNSSEGVTILSRKNPFELISQIKTTDITITNQAIDYYYHSGILFIFDKQRTLWSIKNPSLDSEENKRNLLNEEDTLKLFDRGDIDGLTIDSDKRLFLNRELLTIDFETFHLYHKKLNNYDPWLSEYKDINATEEASKSMTFIGKDSDGNYYWDNGGSSIAVFRNNGFLFEFFLYDDSHSSTMPTVSPEGDIYFMHHAPELVTLYKIKRQW